MAKYVEYMEHVSQNRDTVVIDLEGKASQIYDLEEEVELYSLYCT